MRNLNRGGIGIEIAFLLVAILAGFFLVGGFGNFTKSPTPQSGPGNTSTSALCCDTGSGDACKPKSGDGETFSYKGTQYGLLKTGVKFSEGNIHLKDSKEKFNGNPIIVNTTDTYFNAGSECGGPGKDQIYDGNSCFAIPNDEIVYVCTKNCTGDATGGCVFATTCYGNKDSVFDVYFRLSDYPGPGVPRPIKDCKPPAGSFGGGSAPAISTTQKLVLPSSSPHSDLQMGTFGVITVSTGSGTTPWISPYCKPAIYLYPEKETNVSVKVNSVGPFTYTNPLYSNGWMITAHPDGTISSGTKTFPYLYYEADIPSLLVEKPKEGFVVEKYNVQGFLLGLLPKLGLNAKEADEMAAYWEKALPKSPYYFVGVVSRNTLDSIAPLSITPAPDNLIRVTLFFQPMETRANVAAPEILQKKRDGFTVVEWGGIVKTNKPFACLQ